MYETLLVPLDGSAFAAHAIPVAADIARRTNATVHLALVHDASAYIPFVPGEVVVPVYDATLVRERREADQSALDHAVQTLSAQGVRVVGALLEGTVIESLAEYGQQVATSLTVMTTHGRGGFERLRLGSVSTAYLMRATAPVLLVRAPVQARDAQSSHAPHGALLCPLDGSAFAECMLPHAATFAEACDMTLALFSVTTPHAIALAPFASEALLADPAMLEAEVDQRTDYLQRIATTCPSDCTVRNVSDMSVARAILDEAIRSGAGAIAIATHARSGLMRLMLGSVADEVIRQADVPVLVYRPDDVKKSGDSQGTSA